MDFQERVSPTLAELQVMFNVSDSNIELLELFAKIHVAGGPTTEVMFEKVQKAAHEIESGQHASAVALVPRDQRASRIEIAKRRRNTRLAAGRLPGPSAADHSEGGLVDPARRKEEVTHGSYVVTTVAETSAEVLKTGFNTWTFYNEADESKKRGGLETERVGWERYWSDKVGGFVKLIPVAAPLASAVIFTTVKLIPLVAPIASTVTFSTASTVCSVGLSVAKTAWALTPWSRN